MVSAVAPRPICFASTISADGTVNLSPYSFFNVFSGNPPILIFSPALRGSDSTPKDTLINVREVPEVVINMVSYERVEQMSLASTGYDSNINEFIKAGLTQVESKKVGPPRVGEAPISFECRVNQIIPLGKGPGAGNLVIAQVVLIHVQNTLLTEIGTIDLDQLDLVGRMGGSWYCRTRGDALFEIPKPLRTQGIGVDQLPKGIRESKVLTGNNLGRLGNLERIPSPSEIEAVVQSDEIQIRLKKIETHPEKGKDQWHKLAQRMLEEGETSKALALLMYGETRF